MSKNARRIALLCCGLALATSATAGGRMRSQALDFDDASLKKIKEQLVAFRVHIKPASAGFKLRGIVASGPNVKGNYVFSFFNNAILRSKALTYTVTDGTVEAMVVLEVPRGVYSIRSLEFAPLGEPSASTTVLRHSLTRPVTFEVGPEKVTYLGRLILEIGKPTVTGTIVNRNPVAIAADHDTYKADVAVATSSESDEDIQLLKARYPALSEQTIAVGTLSIADSP